MTGRWWGVRRSILITLGGGVVMSMMVNFMVVGVQLVDVLGRGSVGIRYMFSPPPPLGPLAY